MYTQYYYVKHALTRTSGMRVVQQHVKLGGHVPVGSVVTFSDDKELATVRDNGGIVALDKNVHIGEALVDFDADFEA